MFKTLDWPDKEVEVYFKKKAGVFQELEYTKEEYFENIWAMVLVGLLGSTA